MLLSELIKKSKIDFSSPVLYDQDHNINNICCDSRRAAYGSVFVCMKGAVTDGHIYSIAAYQNGCRIFVAQEKISLPHDAVILYHSDTRQALAELSAAFFDFPAKKLTVIGITGTKGKTTTALFIKNILCQSGIPCGYIGTNGAEYGGRRYGTDNTTPESCELHSYLKKMVDSGEKCVVLEVSSQALHMKRVFGLDFDICVFTNLSEDHIGLHEHPTFEHYLEAKHSLFTSHNAKIAIINADDKYSNAMINGSEAQIITYSTRDGDLSTTDAQFTHTENGSLGMSFTLTLKRASEKAQRTNVLFDFPGIMNVYNALAAIAVCHALNVSIESAASALSDVHIEGRFECIPLPNSVLAVIDYAHNQASMESLLDTVREYTNGRIICIFGSVGGRTRGRRRELALAASSRADLCIITSDNPDCEQPSKIIEEIASFFPQGSCPYKCVEDRTDAIKLAVEIAREGDIIVLAGKGHEKYQLICGKRIPFCERDILLDTAFASRV